MYLNWRWDTILVKPWMGDYEGPGRLSTKVAKMDCFPQLPLRHSSNRDAYDVDCIFLTKQNSRVNSRRTRKL